MKNSLLISLVMTLILWGCQDPEYLHFRYSTEKFYSMVLQEGLGTISPPEAIQLLNEPVPDVVFVDLRSPSAFARGHLEGAVNIPANYLLDPDNLDPFRNSEKSFILYGDDQGDANGPQLLLLQLGFQNIRVLQGGFTHLRRPEAGSLPETTYQAELPRYDFAVTFNKATTETEKETEALIQQPVINKTVSPTPKKQIVPQPKPKALVQEEEGC